LRTTETRLVRGMDPRNPLLARFRRHRGAWLARERMPLTDLCNRLVVTSTRWDTPLPSLGLSPVRPLQPASPFRSSLRPSFQDATVHSDVDEPLPAFSTLGRAAVDAAPPADVRLTAPEGHSVSRAAARWGIFHPERAR
jgi:hypothetical protein